jgi:hypothetical protein
MSQISDLSLRCINYNDRLVSTCHDGLILQTSTKLTKNSALWTVTNRSSLWILVNQVSSIRLTFDTKNKLISSSEDNTPTFNESLKVKDGDRCLLLRLSPGAAAIDNKLALELLAENDHDGKASVVFFVCEAFAQISHCMDLDFFSSSPATKIIADLGDNYYDYVVIGSSFCSLAFIHQTLQNNPKAKFLVLEKGLKYLPEHRQHCPPSSSPGEVEFRPWTIAHKTIQNEFIKNVHGQIPLFGGRSTYWSGWSPTPSANELTSWPEDLKTALQERYFDLARKFLTVIPANQIKAHENNSILYCAFQNCLKKCMNNAANIESVEQVLHAPLAMGNNR